MKKTTDRRKNGKRSKGESMDDKIRAGFLAKSIASDRYVKMEATAERKIALGKSVANSHRARKVRGSKAVHSVSQKGNLS